MNSVMFDLEKITRNEQNLVLNNEEFSLYLQTISMSIVMGQMMPEKILNSCVASFFFGVLTERKRAAMEGLLTGEVKE